VVDKLLQIVCWKDLLSYITADLWSWFTRCPPLPPTWGYRFGSHPNVAKADKCWGGRGSNRDEVFKSYLLLIWSEWGPLQDEDFDEICAMTRSYFGGIRNGRHRADPIQRLDYILGRLGHLKRHRPDLGKHDFQTMKSQYRKLRVYWWGGISRLMFVRPIQVLCFYVYQLGRT